MPLQPTQGQGTTPPPLVITDPDASDPRATDPRYDFSQFGGFPSLVKGFMTPKLSTLSTVVGPVNSVRILNQTRLLNFGNKTSADGVPMKFSEVSNNIVCQGLFNALALLSNPNDAGPVQIAKVFALTGGIQVDTYEATKESTPLIQPPVGVKDRSGASFPSRISAVGTPPFIPGFSVGLRFGSQYIPSGSDPRAGIAHWIQVTGSPSRLSLLTLGEIPTQNADSAGMFWAMDTTGDTFDPFYNTSKSHGGKQGAGDDSHFIDFPFESVANAVDFFGVFKGWWLNASFQPTDTPTSVAPSGGSANYVFITNWQGIDWFAAPGDPTNLVGGWANAVASDAAYSPPPTKTCGNQHFRNDFIVSNTAGNVIFVPVSEFSASLSALGTMVACLGGSAPSPGTITDAYGRYTPIAISKYGFAYGFVTSATSPIGWPLGIIQGLLTGTGI